MGSKTSRRYIADDKIPLISTAPIPDYGILENLREPDAKFAPREPEAKFLLGMKEMLASMSVCPEIKEITLNRCVAIHTDIEEIDYRESIAAMIATKTSLDDAKIRASAARTADIEPHLGSILAAVSVFAHTVSSSENSYVTMMNYVRNTLAQCKTFADLEARIKQDIQEYPRI